MSKSYLDQGRGLLGKGKCLLGFHQGTWEYRISADCTQFRLCERCAVESRRVEHRWDEWGYKAEGTCDLVRACGRCAQTETQLKHVWGEPRYRYADSCEQIAVCVRCGDQEDRKAEHRLDRWEYQNQDDCMQLQACSRCGQRGQTTRLQHDWEPWTRSEFYQSRVCVCRHCGEMLVDAPGAPVSMQAVESAINRLAAAGSWEEIRSRLHADQSTLLSPVVEKYFQFAVEQYPKDQSVTKPLAGAYRIVTRCREVGINQAIEDLGGAAVAQPPQPQQAKSIGTPNATPAAPAAADRLDQRLIGHWRSTEAMPGMAIDSHCVLDAGGDFAFWSKSSRTNSDSEHELGTWEARDGVLHLRFQAGASWSKAYTFMERRMFWPGNRRYLEWERIGLWP